jgi:predicted phage gp36 major capsid-like protein
MTNEMSELRMRIELLSIKQKAKRQRCTEHTRIAKEMNDEACKLRREIIAMEGHYNALRLDEEEREREEDSEKRRNENGQDNTNTLASIACNIAASM